MTNQRVAEGKEMRKRWLQSVFIFIVIILFSVIGYLFLKKYDSGDDLVNESYLFILLQEAVKPLAEL